MPRVRESEIISSVTLNSPKDDSLTILISETSTYKCPNLPSLGFAGYFEAAFLTSLTRTPKQKIMLGIKLSCSRCRARKLKCDRGEPHCKRCQISDEQCTYPERKRSTRGMQKYRINRLDRRLEFLEERIADHLKPTRADARDTEHSIPSPSQSEGLGNETETLTKTWIYHLVSGAKRSIEDQKSKHQSPLATPSPQTQSTVNNAMKRLDTALDQMSVSSPASTSGRHNLHDTIGINDAVRYMEIFLQTLSTVTFIIPFQDLLDTDLLRALPHVINSPHTQVSPAMRIIYLNAIYRGQTFGTAKEYRRAASTYFECLRSVPLWLNSAEGSRIDLIAASLMSWTAIDNFDYHVAWKFHAEACRISALLGIHDVDLSGSQSLEDDAEIDVKRRLHWHLVMTDCLYRLWHDKPSALKCSISQVKLPTEISPRTQQPQFTKSTLFIVWSRALYLLEQFFDLPLSMQGEICIEIKEKVDDCCIQLEDLIEDWGLVSIARSSKLDTFMFWAFMDSTVGFYSLIIYMRRKACSSDQPVHPQAVRAARVVLSILTEWSDHNVAGECEGLHMQMVTFYPFHAFFALYYHLLSSKDLKERENDIQALEKVENKLMQVASIRPDFVPLVNAISALNEVSRAVHSNSSPIHEETEATPRMVTTIGTNESLETDASTSYVSQRPEYDHSQQDHISGWAQPAYPYTTIPEDTSSLESLYNICSALPSDMNDGVNVNFGAPFQLDHLPLQYSAPLTNGDPSWSHIDPEGRRAQPLEYVRAMENNLIRRNWHEDWWNSSGTSKGS